VHRLREDGLRMYVGRIGRIGVVRRILAVIVKLWITAG
jgi:hypothetical protein